MTLTLSFYQIIISSQIFEVWMYYRWGNNETSTLTIDSDWGKSFVDVLQMQPSGNTKHLTIIIWINSVSILSEYELKE